MAPESKNYILTYFLLKTKFMVPEPKNSIHCHVFLVNTKLWFDYHKINADWAVKTVDYTPPHLILENNILKFILENNILKFFDEVSWPE